jgi:polar amino acid transport system substrate-binding protein
MKWLALAVFFLMAGACSVSAQTLRFALGEWPPYTGETLEGNGLASQVVVAACRAAGLVPEFDWSPWRRNEALTADGEVFGTFPYSVFPGRQGRFLFSDPIFTSSFAVLVPVGSPWGSATDPAGFRGAKVGVTAGTDGVMVPFTQAGSQVEETPTAVQSVRKLVQGRLDAVVDDRAVLVYALGTLNSAARSSLKLLDQSFGPPREYRVMVGPLHPGAAALLSRFNTGLARVRADGTWARILVRSGFTR